MKDTTKRVNSKTYFSNLKFDTEVQLFNLKHNGLMSLDTKLVEIALKNLIFYADRKLEQLENKKNDRQ